MFTGSTQAILRRTGRSASNIASFHLTRRRTNILPASSLQAATRSFSSSSSAGGSQNQNQQSRFLAALGAAGVGFVALNAGALSADEALPPFNPDKSRFDLSTFDGRVKAMQELISPDTLLKDDSEIRAAQKHLSTWKSGKYYSESENAAFWESKRLVTASVHPVTGEILLLPGRMAAFVPVNVPVAAGMLMAEGKIMMLVFQVMNQGLNAMCNYTNRSGADIDTAGLAKSFGLACAGATGVVMVKDVVCRLVPPISPLVPFLAVCAASAVNMCVIRYNEWAVDGVPVYSPTGECLGNSKIAGWEGVWRTLTTRGWVAPIPILVFPPMIMWGLKKSILPAAGFLTVVTELSVIAGCMFVFLPYALAIQPQTMEFLPTELEEKFHKLPVSKITANKGL